MFTDFEFAGTNLSDFGFIVGSVDGSGGSNTISIGSDLTFNTVKNMSSSRHTKTSTTYEEVYVSEPIQIIKYDCKSSVTFVDEYEVRAIMKWLNRKEYAIFRPIYEGVNATSDTHWEGYFNVQVITISGEVVGFSLTLTTNAPFGYGDTVSIATTTNNTERTFVIESDSDEVGYIYPDVTIKVLQDGNLTIKNSLDSENLYIANCKSGETITMYGEHKIIKSDMSHENLANDFNYRWIKIFSDYDDLLNEYDVSLPCEIVIEYTPIHKTGVING